MSASVLSPSSSGMAVRMIARRQMTRSAAAAAPTPRRCLSTTACQRQDASASGPSSSTSAYSPVLTPPRPIPSPAEILSGLESGSLVPPSRMKPTMAEFYTGRPHYVKFLIELEDVTRQCRRALESMHILKHNENAPSQKEVAALVGLPSSGRRAVKVASASMWITKDKMSAAMGTTLKSSQYKIVVNGLTTLAKYAPLANFYLTKGSNEAHHKLLDRVTKTLDQYRKDTSANASMRSFFTSKTGVDEEGRIWAKGGRKDSKALVYIAPVEADEGQVALGQVRINNHAMAEYFTQIRHREAIVHPLRLTHLLGQFNIFAIASGGGLTGQSGAVAHGVAKALLRYYEEMEAIKIAELEANTDEDKAHELIKAKDSAEYVSNGVRKVLAKDGVLKRDPRMVERKKTGLAKARKAYTWVKR